MYVKITFGQLFDIAKIKRPDVFTEFFDSDIQEIATDNNWMNYSAEGLKVLFVFDYDRMSADAYEKLAKDGVVIISYKPVLASDGSAIKAVVLTDFIQLRTVWVALGKYIRSQFDIHTIAITGSVGKTTTTAFLEQIFKYEHNVFSTQGNRNNLEYIVREMGRNLSPLNTIHIQEIGGGVINSVSRVASVVRPDLFIITTILPHHMNRYKTFENVIADKTSLDIQAKKGAKGIINIDNDALREHVFKHEIITCGIEHKEADYVAENIRQIKDKLVVEVLHKGERVTISASIPGKHNAYNMLLAYAAANEYGISRQNILKGFSEYKSDLIRQNLTDISGRTMLIDCFNHSVDSIKAALSFANEADVEEENRKIAIIGGENALGPKNYTVNFELGTALNRYDNIDEFVFFGCPVGTDEKEIDRVGNAYAVYEGAKTVLDNKKLSYCSSRKEISQKLRKETKPGDFIVLKGIIHYPLWPAVDLAFASALTIRSNTMVVTEKLQTNKASGVFYKYIEGVNLLSSAVIGCSLFIPERIKGKPVVRLDLRDINGKTKIRNVFFPGSLTNIGVKAFEGCIGLREVFIPKNVIHIDEYAFSGCNNLKVLIASGVEHIEVNAFMNCKSLRKVYLPETCVHIDDSAFAGCGRLTLISESRYVEQWAKTHSIAYKFGKSDSLELFKLKLFTKLFNQFASIREKTKSVIKKIHFKCSDVLKQM